MTSTEELTLRLIYRAEEAAAKLRAHMDDLHGYPYSGRAKAAEALLGQLGRDERLRQATLKAGRRRKYRARSGRTEHVHERF